MDRASDSGSEGWGFESLPVYQKRGCLMASSFLVRREERTRKDGPNKVRAKKCPVDTFLVRGRVHRQQSAVRQDCEMLSIIRGYPQGYPFYLFRPPGGRDSNHLKATVRWTVACRQLDGGNTLIFSHNRGRKCKRVPSGVPIKDGYFDRVTVLIIFA